MNLGKTKLYYNQVFLFSFFYKILPFLLTKYTFYYIIIMEVKYMKSLKFIVITLAILCITSGLPLLFFNNCNSEKYFSTAPQTDTPGPFGYIQKALQDDTLSTETRTDIGNISKEYSNILSGTERDFLKLFLCVSLILGITIITFGIFMLKTSEFKLLATSLITSGTISTILYLLLFAQRFFTIN